MGKEMSEYTVVRDVKREREREYKMKVKKDNFYFYFGRQGIFGRGMKLNTYI